MAKKKIFNEKARRRISKTVKFVENQEKRGVDPQRRNIPDDEPEVWAKILTNEGAGLYTMQEAIRSTNGTLKTLTTGRVFDDSAEGFGQVREVNDFDGSIVGTFVEVALIYDPDEGTAQWYYDAVAIKNGNCSSTNTPANILKEGIYPIIVRQIVEALAAVDGAISIPVVEDGDCIKIGPAIVFGSGPNTPGEFIIPIILGDNVNITIINVNNTTTVQHIGPGPAVHDLVVNDGDTLNIDNTAHIVGKNGTPVDYDDIPVTVSTCKTVYTDDTPLDIVAAIVFALNVMENDDSSAITTACEDEFYQVGFKLLDATPAEFAGYNSQTWVYSFIILETNDDVKLGNSGNIFDTLPGAIVAYSGVNGKDKIDSDFFFRIFIPPNGWGQTLAGCVQIPSQGLSADTPEFPLCDIRGNLQDEDPNNTIIDPVGDVTFDQFYFIDDAAGGQFPTTANDPTGRFIINFVYEIVGGSVLEDGFFETWVETGSPLPSTFWAVRDQRTLNLPASLNGQQLKLTWQLLDVVYNKFIPKGEISKTWDLITGGVLLFCWSDDFSAAGASPDSDRWGNLSTNGNATIIQSGGKVALAGSGTSGGDNANSANLFSSPIPSLSGAFKLLTTFSNISFTGDNKWKFHLGDSTIGGNSSFECMFKPETGQVQFNTGGAAQFTTFATPASGTFIFTRDGSNNCEYIINGTSIATFTAAGDFTSMRMALDDDNSANVASWDIDDVLLESPQGTPYCSPVPGFLTYTHTWAGNADIQSNEAEFDGAGDFVSFPNDSVFDFKDQNFTIEANNLNFDAFPQDFPMILSKWGGAGARSFQFLFRNDTNQLRFAYTTDGSTVKGVEVPWVPATGVNHDVSVSKNGPDVRFFINGVQQGTTQSMGSDIIFSTTVRQIIGSYDDPTATPASNGFLDGTIDELRVSQVVLYTANYTPAPFTNDLNTVYLNTFTGANGSTPAANTQ